MKRNISKSLTRAHPLQWMGGYIGALIFIGLALLSLVVGLVNPQGVTTFRMFISDVLNPLVSAVSAPAQSAADFVGNTTGLANLQAENIRLQDENVKLRQWYQRAQTLQNENVSLKKLFNVKLNPVDKYITARVFSDSGRTFANSLLISSGRADGVDKGQAVISGEGVVGRVVEVGNTTARVLLVNDINARVPVLVEGENLKAIMAGANSDYPVLLHVPDGLKLQNGIRIVTSGDGGMFPKGLPVGRLKHSGDGAYEVDLFAEFNRITYVRIVNHNAESLIIDSPQN